MKFYCEFSITSGHFLRVDAPHAEVYTYELEPIYNSSEAAAVCEDRGASVLNLTLYEDIQTARKIIE